MNCPILFPDHVMHDVSPLSDESCAVDSDVAASDRPVQVDPCSARVSSSSDSGPTFSPRSVRPSDCSKLHKTFVSEHAQSHYLHIHLQTYELSLGIFSKLILACRPHVIRTSTDKNGSHFKTFQTL